MTEMLRRLAWALNRHSAKRHYGWVSGEGDDWVDTVESFDDLSEVEQKASLEAARVVLQEMREPTVKVLLGMSTANVYFRIATGDADYNALRPYKEMWKAAIDEALK